MAKRKLSGRVMLGECPNCQSIWGPGSEEWDWQQCDSCGWPNPDCKNFMKEDDEELGDDWGEEWDTESDEYPKITKK
jgi:hypothetical protein